MRNLRQGKIKENDNIQKEFYVFDTETTCLEPMPKNFVFGVIYGYYDGIVQGRFIYSVNEFKKEFEKEK